MTNQIKIYVENNMVLIPSGLETIKSFRDNQKWISSDYRMSIPGTKNNLEESERDVPITSFYLGKYLVTASLYDAITKKTLLDHIAQSVPIVNISWMDAVRFCNLLSTENGFNECYSFQSEKVICNFDANGYRLPTEAEWQYACKAGTNKYHYGSLNDIAWYDKNSANTIHAIGQKESNIYGLYDILGNVWEWCWDLYNEETYGSYRVFRGGSFASNERECGATCRKRSNPDFSIDDLGFRIARRK